MKTFKEVILSEIEKQNLILEDAIDIRFDSSVESKNYFLEKMKDSFYSELKINDLVTPFIINFGKSGMLIFSEKIGGVVEYFWVVRKNLRNKRK